MTMKWDEVAQSPEYQELKPDQQEAARNQYFDQVILPNIPAEKFRSIKAQFDATTAPKKGMIESAYGAAKDWVTGANTEDLPELADFNVAGAGLSFQEADSPVGMMNIANKQRQTVTDRGGKVPMVSDVTQDKFGNPVAVEEGGRRAYFNKPGPSMADIEYVKEGVRNLIPAVMGGASVQGAKLAGSALRTGAGTAGSELLAQVASKAAGSGEALDPYNVALQGVFGAGGDAASRIVAPKIASAAASTWRTLFGDKAGQVSQYFDGTAFTPAGIAKLNEAKVSPEAVSKKFAEELDKVGGLTKEQAERWNLFQKHNMRPTKPQLTQDVDEFAFQQQQIRPGNEAGKELRSNLDQQNAQMIGLADTASTATGGRVGSREVTGASLQGFITKKALDADQAVFDIYKQVRESTPKDMNVKLTSFWDSLRSRASSDAATGHQLTRLKNDLQIRGILDKNNRIVGKIDVDTAEEVRKTLNTIYAEGNPTARTIVKDLKDALDEDVFKVAGQDFYKSARQKKIDFHKEFTDFAENKLQTHGKNILEKLYDGSVAPDKAYTQVISGPLRDVIRVKQALVTGTKEQVAQGTQVWNDVRGQVLRDAISAAQKGPVDQLGNTLWNAKAFAKELNSYKDSGKLTVLFPNPTEQTMIRELIELGNLRTPKATGSGTSAIGLGPSAPAIERIERILSQTTIGRPVIPFLMANKEMGKFNAEVAAKKGVRDAMNPEKETVDALRREAMRQRANQTRMMLQSKAAQVGGLSGIGAAQMGNDQ